MLLIDIDLISEEAVMLWITVRRLSISTPHTELDSHTKARNALFKEPKVQDFVEWMDAPEEDVDEDDDDSYSDEN